jgi:hypothetical protein
LKLFADIIHVCTLMSIKVKTPSSAQRPRDVFLAALEIPHPRDRLAFLESACGNDRDLRRRGAFRPVLESAARLATHCPAAIYDRTTRRLLRGKRT